MPFRRSQVVMRVYWRVRQKVIRAIQSACACVGVVGQTSICPLTHAACNAYLSRKGHTYTHADRYEYSERARASRDKSRYLYSSDYMVAMSAIGPLASALDGPGEIYIKLCCSYAGCDVGVRACIYSSSVRLFFCVCVLALCVSASRRVENCAGIK